MQIETESMSGRRKRGKLEANQGKENCQEIIKVGKHEVGGLLSERHIVQEKEH